MEVIAMSTADVGLIGLAVMGQNLALNMDEHGFHVAVFNRNISRVDEFLAGAAAQTGIVGARSIEGLAASLARPRIVVLMVKAGAAVDAIIEQLTPHLEAGDVIIDGGNSLYSDTERRVRDLALHGLRYVGAGISGGEEGARHGPSIMPGGNPQAWPVIKSLLQAIAARVAGEPCCHWVGEGGAGHYVKMVHNGIEYGDMQLIAEAYDVMRNALGMDADALQSAFARWRDGPLDSYLVDITAEILAFRDEGGEPLLEHILDSAGQKGTGRWTGIEALELGVPLTLIGEAVFARCLSARKEERERASNLLGGGAIPALVPTSQALRGVHDALYASKIVSYAQGFMLMREASGQHDWNLRYGDIALMWRGGCIIRSRFLDDIKAAFDRAPELENLLLDRFFSQALARAEPGWREAVMLAVGSRVPAPAFSSALAFFDGYRSATLPANLIQAQRDYFGAHTYERLDRPRGEFFHTDWIGSGGGAASGSYEA
jgi:6-phosphogluconate dehydrogenase